MAQSHVSKRGTLPTDLEQRRHALRGLLVISPLGGVVFLALNLRLGAPLLSGLSLLLIIGSLALLLALQHDARVERLALVYLAILYAPILVMLAMPDIHPGATNSMAILPVLAYLLLEHRTALPVASLSLLAAAVAYFAGVGAAPYRLEPMMIAHIGMPTVALFVLCHFYSRNRIRSGQQILDNMFRDPLTRLWNRDKLDLEFEREATRSQRTGAPLTLLLLDIDEFKVLNDRYGHGAGDDVLVAFAERVASRLRDIDIACRIGGDEFVLLLPDTERVGAAALATKIQGGIAETAVQLRGDGAHVTVSIGAAQLGPDGQDWSSLYQTADARLYEAKEAGRNAVVCGPNTPHFDVDTNVSL